MTAEQLKTYQQLLLNNVLTQKLQQNEKETKTWSDYKKRHKKVIEGLQVYPLSLSEKCMVPIGKLALMRGKLTHTNEILVFLGDSYFAKYSASQAIALCNRRIAKADEMLKRLETERNLIEARQILPLEHDIFGEKDKKEILEYVDDDELEKWRMQHKQHMKEYRQKLAKTKEKSDIRTEEDLAKRLDELELEEELEDEIYRLEAQRKKFYGNDLNEGEVYDESEESESESDESTDEMNEEEESKKSKEISESDIDTSNISSKATQDKIIDTIENVRSNCTVNSDEEKSNEDCLSEAKTTVGDIKKRKVSFFVEPSIEKDETTETISQEFCSGMKQDDTCGQNPTDDIIRITFSHSSYNPSTSALTSTEIQSPADIYKMFNTHKSILKRSPNDMVSNPIPPLNDHDSTDDEDKDDSAKHSAYDSVITEVRENQLASSTVEKREEKKIVSKFKLERAKRMK